ncbi:MAG TPA: hypothetical protein VMR21_14850 [Vicinamibacteria bacterium]|nr:hypothetical protein [Vicinamibacteria bacterium]
MGDRGKTIAIVAGSTAVTGLLVALSLGLGGDYLLLTGPPP